MPTHPSTPLIVIVTAACAPSLSNPSKTPTPQEPVEDGSLPVDTGVPPTPDPPEPDDTGGVEVIPAGAAEARLSPSARLFNGTLEVSVRSSEDIGETFACVGVPSAVCEMEPAETLTLTGSGVVYARVDINGIPGDISATPYVHADDDVLAFTSNLPLMVAWSDRETDGLRTNTPMVLLTFDPETGRTALNAEAQLASRMRLRIRGSSSADLTKKNYDVELWGPDSTDDAPAPVLGLPEEADWVFHGPSFYDDALIRNALGYQLSRDMGRYAPKTAFSEMFLLTSPRTLTMDHYIGVYVVTEELKQGADRVDIARLDEEDTVWPEVSGGYIFKRDREGESGEGLWAGDGGGAFAFSEPIVPVDPESDDLQREQREYLETELDSLGYALAASSGVDPFSGRAWQDIVDADSFIDHNILAALVKNPDAFRLSGYFHKDREGPILAGPIWDLDRTAGSIDSRARDPHRWDATNETSDTTPIFTYGWYAPMFADADFRAAYWTRWQSLLDGPLSPSSVQTRIDEMAALLSEAGPRNNVRWGAPSWTSELDHISGWYQSRLTWIDTCIETMDDPRECAGAHASP